MVGVRVGKGVARNVSGATTAEATIRFSSLFVVGTTVGEGVGSDSETTAATKAVVSEENRRFEISLTGTACRMLGSSWYLVSVEC